MKPIINKVLDISTSHVTMSEMELLSERSFGVSKAPITYPYPEGAFVYVPDDIEGNETDWKELGLSQGFIDILKVAKTEECKYVQFDRDAQTYIEFPVHDWGDG